MKNKIAFFVVAIALLLAFCFTRAAGTGETMANSFPVYKSMGWKGIKGKATGFFHTEKKGDVWWVIDPEGNSFYIIGTDHANYNVHWCEKLGYAPYHKSIQKIYGSETKWADTTVSRLISWEFNSLGANSSPSTRRKGLAHMEFLSMGSGFAGSEAITPKTTWTGFPNVFSPRFEKYCDRIAKKICAENRDDPWLIGYFIDNELEWHQWTGGGIFGDAFKKPAANTAKIALVEFFKARYKDADEFNKAWGTSVTDLNELLELRTPPSSAEPRARADMNDFIRLVAEKYFSITSAAIRNCDPNHMVLGCRFAGSAPDVWDIAGKYCDIVSVNCYRTVDLEKEILADGFESDLLSWYKKTGKPMMITEWSFPALDAGLPCKGGAGQRVKTQKDKALAFTIFQKLLFLTPFLVGSDYFMWVDEPELGISKTFPEDSNYGLVNVNDEPYALLTEAATALHKHVYEIHGGNTPEVYAKPGKEPDSFLIGNSGKAKALCRVTLWKDGKVEEKSVELGPGAEKELKAGTDSVPGGHFFACDIQPQDTFLEINRQDNIASLVFYVPGTTALKGASARVPFVIANAGKEAVKDARVSIDLMEFGQSGSGISEKNCMVVRAKGNSQEPVPFQFIPGEKGREEIVVSAGDIGPMQSAAFFIYKGISGKQMQALVKYEQEDKGFNIDNNVLTFSKNNFGSNAFDKIEMGGIELGRLNPLLWQKTGQNVWSGPDRVESVEISNGPVCLVADIYFSRNGPPLKFGTKYRFKIFPGRNYFSSRVLWIENTDERSWELAGYYHYITSNIDGKRAENEAKGNYWIDSGTGLCYGAETLSPLIKVYLWKDPQGNEHPDVWRELNVTLKPGERYGGSEPEVFVIGAKEAEWKGISRGLKALSALAVRVFPEEK